MKGLILAVLLLSTPAQAQNWYQQQELRNQQWQAQQNYLNAQRQLQQEQMWRQQIENQRIENMLRQQRQMDEMRYGR